MQTPREKKLKLTIFKRLVISYLLIIMLVSASGVYILFCLNNLDKMIRSMNTIDVQAIRLAKEIAQTLYIQTGYEKKYLISGDRDFLNQFEKMSGDMDKKTAELEEVATGPAIKAWSRSLKTAHQRYQALFAKMAERKAGPKDLAARDKAIAEIERATQAIAELSDKSRNQKLQSSGRISTQIAKAITISGTAAIILMVLISFLITRSINNPIRLLLAKTKMIAKGEFDRPLKIVSPPEIKEFAESFNFMCSRLQELDQMKIDFISHLSHELRTPLTAIKEASSMLMEGVYAGCPEKQQELFDIVNGECGRLIASVSRILDLSRMEAGMAQFQFEMSDMAPLVRNISAKLEPIAGRKHIRLHLDLPDGIPEVRMDEDKIGQVIENVIANALKFTAEGGEIAVILSVNGGHSAVQVAVSDTGCGIPAENLQEIFDKFKRVDDRKGAVRGTGLGLAIAKHIINAHGGAIWAESEPGKGSTFIFSLPLSPPESF